jgi:hypothetical protein
MKTDEVFSNTVIWTLNAYKGGSISQKQALRKVRLACAYECANILEAVTKQTMLEIKGLKEGSVVIADKIRKEKNKEVVYSYGRRDGRNEEKKRTKKVVKELNDWFKSWYHYTWDYKSEELKELKEILRKLE